MNLKVQVLLFCAFLSSRSGCQNNAESRAVDLCFKQAPQLEVELDKNVKGTLRDTFEVQEIGPAHFLVEANYLVGTMENPNPSRKDILSIKTITCEIKDGEIVDGAYLGTKFDQIIRKVKKKWPNNSFKPTPLRGAA